MAYTYPLPHGDFMDWMPIRSQTFDIPESVELSETGGGEILTAALGTSLWQGEITLGNLTADETDRATAAIDVARRNGASFMVYDVRRPAPRLDPNGTILGAAAPVIANIAANWREISISGLPAGYAIRQNDYIAFSYGSNPVRYALHRAVVGRSATGAGVTPWIEVTPTLRPGATVGTAITLLRASCKAVIVPGSVQPGRSTQTMTDGISFKWRQTLR